MSFRVPARGLVSSHFSALYSPGWRKGKRLDSHSRTIFNACVRLEDDRASSILEAIITAPKVPTIVVKQSATMLLSISVATEITVASASARRLLSIVQQRYPSALQEAAEVLASQDEALKESVEQLIVSLSVVCLPFPITHPSTEIS
jgi:predicted transcriptional regulator